MLSAPFFVSALSSRWIFRESTSGDPSFKSWQAASTSTVSLSRTMRESFNASEGRILILRSNERTNPWVTSVPPFWLAKYAHSEGENPSMDRRTTIEIGYVIATGRTTSAVIRWKPEVACLSFSYASSKTEYSTKPSPLGMTRNSEIKLENTEVTYGSGFALSSENGTSKGFNGIDGLS